MENARNRERKIHLITRRVCQQNPDPSSFAPHRKLGYQQQSAVIHDDLYHCMIPIQIVRTAMVFL